jgi:hypothetical protein
MILRIDKIIDKVTAYPNTVHAITERKIKNQNTTALEKKQ